MSSKLFILDIRCKWLLVLLFCFCNFGSFASWEVKLNTENWLITDNSLLQTEDTILKVRVNGIDTILHFRFGKAAYGTNTNQLLQVSRPGVSGFPRMFMAIDTSHVQEIAMWKTLLPPLIAIILALLFKEVLIALFAGIWVGAWLLHGLAFNKIVNAFFASIDTFIVQAMSDNDHVAVIIFSILIGGMVAIISRNGGMAGVVSWLSKFAKNAQSTQLVTWLLGVAIFFDDYANTLIVGNTMRPVADKHKISRAKLAYLVDSTAAPVAAVAFVTTWIGAELGYIQQAANSLGFTEGAYSIFFNSLRYAYYPFLTLFFMLIIILLSKDYGPMLKAELEARKNNNSIQQSHNSADEFEPINPNKLNGWLALLPVFTVVFGTFYGLLYTGFDAEIWRNSEIGLLKKLSITIGNANSYQALMWSSLSAVVIAILLSLANKIMTLSQCLETLVAGFKAMLPAILVLILAWSLAGITKELFTAEYLTSFFSDNVSAKSLPIVTFFLSAIIAFSTGSSWGTMAILYPLMIPAAWLVSQFQGLSTTESMEIVYHTTSVVLAGAVFGDHCSPISDTTILSSLASQCNHIEHVKTQMPYAITVALVSTCLCVPLSNFGLPWYFIFPFAILTLFLIVKFFGKKVPI